MNDPHVVTRPLQTSENLPLVPNVETKVHHLDISNVSRSTSELSLLAGFIAEKSGLTSKKAEERIFDGILNGGRYTVLRLTAPYESIDAGSIVAYSQSVLAEPVHRALQPATLASFIQLVRDEMPPGGNYAIVKANGSLATSRLNDGHTDIVRASDGSLDFYFDYYQKIGLRTQGSHTVGMISFVRPDMRGHNLGSIALKENFLSRAHDKVGWGFAFARMANYSRYCPDPQQAAAGAQDYLELRDQQTGFHPDPTIALHQKTGGVIVCAIPNCFFDPLSHHWGAFVIYDLSKLKPSK